MIWDSRTLDALILSTAWLDVAADPHNSLDFSSSRTNWHPTAADCTSWAAAGLQVCVGTLKGALWLGWLGIVMLRRSPAKATTYVRTPCTRTHALWQDLLGCNNSALPASLKAFDAAMFAANFVSTKRGWLR